MKEQNFTKSLIGWIIVGIGIIALLFHFVDSSSAEYVTHQTLYAIQSTNSLLVVIIGLFFILWGKP